VTAHHQPANAQVAREFHVGLAIADHGAGREIYFAFAHPVVYERGFRLAAVAAVGLAMRADEHGVELHALRDERIQHEMMGHVEGRLRKKLAAEAIQIRDNGQL
jgi:hypothetical protein